MIKHFSHGDRIMEVEVISPLALNLLTGAMGVKVVCPPYLALVVAAVLGF